jgi:hypothetical protein
MWIALWLSNTVDQLSQLRPIPKQDLHGIQLWIPPTFGQSGYIILCQFDLLPWLAILEHFETGMHYM